MGIVDRLVKFSIKKNLSKAARGAGVALVSALAPFLAEYAGVELNDEQKLAVSGAVGASIIGASNFLKTTFPENFGWL